MAASEAAVPGAMGNRPMPPPAAIQCAGVVNMTPFRAGKGAGKGECFGVARGHHTPSPLRVA